MIFFSEEVARILWKKNFLGKDYIPFEDFANVFFQFLSLETRKESIHYQILYTVMKDIGF